MNRDEQLEGFPTRRIEPIDGMPVTASVWAEAHDYHRLHLRSHNALAHGPGILLGLEVIASDPPDTSIYVMPGLAIDPSGAVIAVSEPVAFDIGASRGRFRLLLTYGESAPRPEGGSELLYVHTEFGIEAHSAPDGAGVELARIWRTEGEDPIIDAANADYPSQNEIDLRFRPELARVAPQVAHIAVCLMDGDGLENHYRGIDALARALREAGRLPVWVDRDVPLDSDLTPYSLVYLVGHDAFEFSADGLNALYAYLQQGGTVLMESCRRESEAPAADAVFREALASLGVELVSIEPGHPLLTKPNLFSAPPPGYTEGHLLIGGGVVFSNLDYGCLWQGQQAEGPASREAIRASHEWGHNLITFALQRHSGRAT